MNLPPRRTGNSPRQTVIQGSFRGGLPVVQARFRAAPAAVQPHKRPGVEAFSVNLRPKAGGQPLPPEVQAKMESALGADFSDVRVHVGREAASVGAIAFTWGSDIHFAPGQYNPNTTQGQKLLGHELAHVVQQRAGRVSNPFGSGVAVVQDRALEAEADRLGSQAAMTPAPARRSETAQAKPAPHAVTIQRFHAQPGVQTPGGPQTITVSGSGSGSSRPIGSVKLWSRGSGVVEITDMHVQREHRRQGVGRALMNAAIQRAVRQGFTTARLEANPYDGGMTRQTLASMYQRMGFQPVGMSTRGNPVMQRSVAANASSFPGTKAVHPLGQSPILQARMAKAGRPVGVIQTMKSNQEFLEPMITDITDQYSGRNDSGVVFGNVIPRGVRTFGQNEVDERFLRHVSNFFYWYVNEWCEKGDAEVEAMWVNDRLVISSNNTGTMKQVFKWMKSEDSLLDFFLTFVQSKDQRGTTMLGTFDRILQSPNTTSDVALTLQGLSFEDVSDAVVLVHANKLAGAITNPSYAEKVILVHGLNQHAEQKLMVGLASSSLSKYERVVIRGKKRPCFGCWIGLCFLSEFLGYSNLSFNQFQGKAWVGSCRTLGSLIKVALAKGKRKQDIQNWINTKNSQVGTQITHVSMIDDVEDPGYDSESDDEMSCY